MVRAPIAFACRLDAPCKDVRSFSRPLGFTGRKILGSY
jgi:hypothetical protein